MAAAPISTDFDRIAAAPATIPAGAKLVLVPLPEAPEALRSALTAWMEAHPDVVDVRLGVMRVGDDAHAGLLIGADVRPGVTPAPLLTEMVAAARTAFAARIVAVALDDSTAPEIVAFLRESGLALR